ncbi:MAG: lasso peptide [Nostochopsis sp.]
MKQTYNTPKMIVHGNLAELTQVAGRNVTKDVLFFNGNPSGIESDDSMDLDCDTTTGNCQTR